MAAALRVSGPVLPDGESRDLYVVDGRVTYEPQPGADTVAEGWIVPGLVDAHNHLGLEDGVAHFAVLLDEPLDEGWTNLRTAGPDLAAQPRAAATATRWRTTRALARPRDGPRRAVVGPASSFGACPMAHQDHSLTPDRDAASCTYAQLEVVPPQELADLFGG